LKKGDIVLAKKVGFQLVRNCREKTRENERGRRELRQIGEEGVDGEKEVGNLG
jgi:hypothetical protein